MKIIFDFETHDPEIDTRGPGWAFNSCKVLGMGYTIDNNGPILYTREPALMIDLLNKANIWVAHNISYELGVAKMLGIDFRNKEIYCTKVGAYLEDNTKDSYSLESLGKEFELDKMTDDLEEFVLTLDNLKFRKLVNDPDYKKQALKWAYQNMNILDELNPKLIENYGKKDIEITRELHNWYYETGNRGLYRKFSEVNKCLVEMRALGVRIDYKAIDSARKDLDQLINAKEIAVKDAAGIDFNYRSSKQSAQLFAQLGHKIKLTDKGNPSIDHKFLEELAESGCQLAQDIIDVKKYTKARDEFIVKLEELQANGRIHGEMLLFGGEKTGRFSHKHPNLSQIPRRDDIVGPLMRKLFIPDEGKKWISVDWSAQEPRLIVHFAALCHRLSPWYEGSIWKDGYKAEFRERFNCPMIEQLVHEYKENPQLDSHAYNAELIKQKTGLEIERSHVKTIALGKAYGMGQEKLAKSLKIAMEVAKEFIDAFYSASPYLNKLDNYCKYIYNKYKGIKTLSGRIIKFDGAVHKALNKKIQGSAADMMCEVLNKCYEQHIIPHIVSHDEINISGNEEDLTKLVNIMQDTVKLEIPVYAEASIGNNWGECK